MYFIFLHDSIYHSGILYSLKKAACSAQVAGSLLGFPLRTNSIILKAFPAGTPHWIKLTMISSRHPITFLNGTWIFPFSSGVHKSLALPNHTSVPCERPDILISSANVVGFVSSSIPSKKDVPNSGTPRVPVGQYLTPSLLVKPLRRVFSTPKTSGPVKIFIVSRSPKSILVTSIPERSCNIFNTVGSSCPSISSFKRSASIAW